MTDCADTTMASAEAADPPFKLVTNPSKSKRLKVTPAQKESVERTHSFTIHAYFPPERQHEVQPRNEDARPSRRAT